MIDTGEILTQVRIKDGFSSAKAAVKAMKNQGCSINYEQYLALEKGKMPSRAQMHEVCAFFHLEPNCWFMGDCDNSSKYCDILDGLSPQMKKMFFAMAKTGAEHLKEYGLDFPSN